MTSVSDRSHPLFWTRIESVFPQVTSLAETTKHQLRNSKSKKRLARRGRRSIDTRVLPQRWHPVLQLQGALGHAEVAHLTPELTPGVTHDPVPHTRVRRRSAPAGEAYTVLHFLRLADSIIALGATLQ